MIFLLSMPGGSEWLLMGGLLLINLAFPILAILYFVKYRSLKKDMAKLSAERDDLLRRLLDKAA